MTRLTIAAITTALLFSVACGPPPGPSTTIERINPNAQVDLSGEWNDSDARQVARSMIQTCLSSPWLAKFKAEKGRDPVIRLSPIRNRSSDHINWRFISKQVESELVNSGQVQVVADWEEAEDQRYERSDQAEHASDETVKSQGQETGSDFLLNGWIITQNDVAEGREVRSYITTMELINSKSNVKVWMNDYPIKKVITRAPSQW